MYEVSSVPVFIAVGPNTSGPYTISQLKMMWTTGQVGQDARYWYRGMARWKPVSEFQQPGPKGPPPSEITLTTAMRTARGEVEEELDIVTAECTFGMNIFRDFLASLTDIFGGRSESTQKLLREARTTCLNELRKEAASVGADAVIAVDLDYSEFSGQGKSMLFLVASGTAVRLNLSTSPPPHSP